MYMLRGKEKSRLFFNLIPKGKLLACYFSAVYTLPSRALTENQAGFILTEYSSQPQNLFFVAHYLSIHGRISIHSPVLKSLFLSNWSYN